LLAPSIVTQPADQIIKPRQPITISVLASGQGPLSYQWYIGNSGDTSQPINGAHASSYTISTLTSTTRFWVRVSNISGSADSRTTIVKVQYNIHLPLIMRAFP
ncbi:MAG TPA: immunoglobulin domain-containing protein, partial [Anaerolineae bacterium]|nr:immunoglobulin domain-containing protein [Anaerolineae bacterium]